MPAGREAEARAFYSGLLGIPELVKPPALAARGGAWFESGPEPVFAAASASEETAFVRVLILPREWAGKRTIRYVNEEDEDKPKTQRATVFLDEPIELV